MKSKILYLLLFASSFSCSKNSPGNNNNNNQEVGPFTIYSGFVCPGNNVGLVNARIEA